LTQLRAEKIALFLPSLEGGGAERSMLHIARGFVDRGRQVDLVLCQAKGAYMGDIPAGVNLVELKAAGELRGRWNAAVMNPREFWALLRPVLLAKKNPPEVARIRSFQQYIDQHRPDIVVSALSYANLVALWAKDLSQHKPPIIVSERNALATLCATPAKYRKWRWRFLPDLVRRTYPRAEAVIAVSANVAQELCDKVGLPRELVKTVYNPVVDDTLRKCAAEPVTHPWLAPGQPPVILGVGRLQIQKDFATLLQAFARVRKERPARLLILGEGSQRQQLQQLAEQLGVAEDVELAGFVDNPFSYMSRASLLALSSRYEGLPGALIQAMACGCPVLSTDCPGGSYEILEGGKLGPLVPIGDAAAMATAIVQQLDQPVSREALQGRAEDFTTTRAVDNYLALVDATYSRVHSATSAIDSDNFHLKNNELKRRTEKQAQSS